MRSSPRAWAATTPAARRARSAGGRRRSCRRRARTTSPPTRGSGSTGAGASSRPAFFNGPTGPERQDPVDGADHLVAGELARPELRGARGRRARHAGDRLLLRRRRRAARECCWPDEGQPGPATLIAGRGGARAAAAVGPARAPAGSRRRPLRVARRRAWGQMTHGLGGACSRATRASSSASGCCSSRSGSLIALLQWLLFQVTDPRRRWSDEAGRAQRVRHGLALSLGVVLTLLGYSRWSRPRPPARWWRSTPAGP